MFKFVKDKALKNRKSCEDIKDKLARKAATTQADLVLRELAKVEQTKFQAGLFREAVEQGTADWLAVPSA